MNLQNKVVSIREYHSGKAHNGGVVITDLTAKTLIEDNQGALCAWTTQATSIHKSQNDLHVAQYTKDYFHSGKKNHLNVNRTEYDLTDSNYNFMKEVSPQRLYISQKINSTIYLQLCNRVEAHCYVVQYEIVVFNKVAEFMKKILGSKRPVLYGFCYIIKALLNYYLVCNNYSAVAQITK